MGASNVCRQAVHNTCTENDAEPTWLRPMPVVTYSSLQTLQDKERIDVWSTADSEIEEPQVMQLVPCCLQSRTEPYHDGVVADSPSGVIIRGKEQPIDLIVVSAHDDDLDKGPFGKGVQRQ